MAVQGWSLGFTFSAAAAAALLAVAAALALGLTRTRQWRSNPLGAGTVLVFLTAGGGHALHALQLLDAGPLGLAARAEAAQWPLLLADGAAAAAGAWYWSLRARFPALAPGAAVYEDLRMRQREALDIHDNVVQGLAKAKLALEVQQPGEGERAVAETLRSTRRIVSDLLGDGEARRDALRRGPGGGDGR